MKAVWAELLAWLFILWLALAVAYWFRPDLQLALATTAAFALIAASVAAAILVGRVRRRQYLLKLLADGHIDRFLPEAKLEIRESKRPAEIMRARAVRVAGLVLSGRFAEATDDIRITDEKALGHTERLLFACARVLLPVLTGRVEEAVRIRESLSRTLRAPQVPGFTDDLRRLTLLITEAEAGNLAGHADAFRALAEDHRPPVIRAFAHFFLAGALMEADATAPEAGLHLTKAMALGKETFLMGRALELQAQLRERS